jgi:hypothetical protein
VGTPDKIAATLALSSVSYTVNAEDPPISAQHPKITELLLAKAFYCNPVVEDPSQLCAWDYSRDIRRAAYSVLGIERVTEHSRKGQTLGSSEVAAIEMGSVLRAANVEVGKDLRNLPSEVAELVLRTMLVGSGVECLPMSTILVASFIRSIVSNSADLKLRNHELLALVCSLVLPRTLSNDKGNRNKRSIHLSASFQAFLASCAVLLRSLGLERQAEETSDWDAVGFFSALGKARGGAGFAALIPDFEARETVRQAYSAALQLGGSDAVDLIFDYEGSGGVSAAVKQKKAEKKKKKVVGSGEKQGMAVGKGNVFEVLAAIEN